MSHLRYAKEFPHISQDVQLPDYYQYAQLINVLLKQGRLGDVEQELQKLFKQGYELGLNKGWAIEQDTAEEWFGEGNF